MPMTELTIEITVRGGPNGQRAMQTLYRIPADGSPGLTLDSTRANKVKNRVETIAGLVDEAETVL